MAGGVGDGGVGEDLVGLVESVAELVGGRPRGGQPVATDRRDRDRVAEVRTINDDDLLMLDQVVEDVLDLAEQLRQPVGHQGEFAEQVVEVGDVQRGRPRTRLVVQGPDGFGGRPRGFLRCRRGGHDAVPDPGCGRFSSSTSESRAASN